MDRPVYAGILFTAPAPSRTTVCRSGAKNSAATAAISSARDRVDLRQHLVERAVLVVVEHEAGQPAHPGARALERQHDLPLELLLAVGQLGRRAGPRGRAARTRRGSPRPPRPPCAGWVPT